MKRFLLWLATGFGLGNSPVASGTVGALLGLPLVYLAAQCPSVVGQTVFALLLTAAAVPVCDVAEKTFQKKDDGRIVADEYFLLPLVFIGIPLSPLMLAVGFVVSRGFDILKPWPARGLQRLTGGIGIVIDDFLASIYALAANHVAYHVMKHWGWL